MKSTHKSHLTPVGGFSRQSFKVVMKKQPRAMPGATQESTTRVNTHTPSYIQSTWLQRMTQSSPWSSSGCSFTKPWWLNPESRWKPRRQLKAASRFLASMTQGALASRPQDELLFMSRHWCLLQYQQGSKSASLLHTCPFNINHFWAYFHYQTPHKATTHGTPSTASVIARDAHSTQPDGNHIQVW